MSTTLIAAEQELSKQLGDYWYSATTAGTGSTTTLIDTALKAKSNDWITGDTWAMLEEEPSTDAAIYDERKISSLDNSTGTLTVLAFAGIPGPSLDYSVHRLFTPSDKRIALVAACREAYPYIFKRVWDESHVSGNWLKDGSFEVWTSTSALTHWTSTITVLAQTSTVGLFKHGSYSAGMGGAAAVLKQGITNNDDLKRLAGKNVTFTVQAKSSAANGIRLSIYDGVTRTYSDYNDQITGWTLSSEPLEVTATIADEPSEITFEINQSASTTNYVDDARVIDNENPRIYIGELGMGKNTPGQVFYEPADYYQGEPWVRVSEWGIDPENGYLHLPDGTPKDRRLRIIGTNTLDFLASGVSSTAWTATVAVDQPQLDILVQQAIIELYKILSKPNLSTGERKNYREAQADAEVELQRTIRKVGMTLPPMSIHYTV